MLNPRSPHHQHTGEGLLQVHLARRIPGHREVGFQVRAPPHAPAPAGGGTWILPVPGAGDGHWAVCSPGVSHPEEHAGELLGLVFGHDAGDMILYDTIF